MYERIERVKQRHHRPVASHNWTEKQVSARILDHPRGRFIIDPHGTEFVMSHFVNNAPRRADRIIHRYTNHAESPAIIMAA